MPFTSSPGFGTVIGGDNLNFGTAPTGNPELTVAGQIMIATGNPFPAIQVAPNTLTAGPGISITNGAGSITITNTGAGVTFSTIAVNTVGVTNHGYITNAAATIQVSLPAVSSVGDQFIIERNLNAGGQ
jgi:hypothetical protein